MVNDPVPVEPATDQIGPERPVRSRSLVILLLTAAAIVLLLVGATLGLALSGSFRSAPANPDSSSVDAGFARDMIVHHDQGVLMAHYAEQNTTDPEIDVMAYDIGYTQTDQTPLMPGMATDSEMARLKALRGTESDVYFLQLMVRHHQGGAPMMEYAAGHATNPVVRNFARKMADSQSAEIAVMTQMLRERGAEPLPAPAG